MARINHVKAFRGQRKCQFVVTHDGWSQIKCGMTRKEHELGEEVATVAEMTITHTFLQAPLNCDFCDEPINIGQAYKWTAPRAHRAAAGHKKSRHEEHPSWRPSQMTTSPYLSAIYAAGEGVEDALNTATIPTDPDDAEAFIEELKDTAQQATDELEAVAEQYEESSSNIEDGFGHPTYQSEELQERADEVRGWADELGYIDFEEFTLTGQWTDHGTVISAEAWRDDGSTVMVTGDRRPMLEALSAHEAGEEALVWAEVWQISRVMT